MMPLRRLVPAVLGLAVAALVALPAAAADLAASVARGGRLYDNWYKELGEEAPRTSHPSYPSGQPFAPDRFWRCVECHGWDYRGADGAFNQPGPFQTGIKGIRGQAKGDPQKIAALLEGPSHGYGEYLDRQDIADLANFVAFGQVTMEDHIDSASGRAKGEAERGNVLYQTVCANCHGTDGQQIANAPPLGEFTRRDPWQALHDILNGHPGGTMPALRELDRQLLIDTLAYIQSLPPRQTMAAIVRGGRLYDNWYKETGRSAPAGVHPAFPVERAAGIEPRTTWRCKECHGWDYKGKDGAYGAGRHHTGITGLRRWQGGNPVAVVATLKDRVHQYGGLMSDRDFNDLALFVTQGQVDMDEYIDRASLAARAEAGRWKSHYLTICASCHGADGTDIRTMPPLGRIATTEPWRALHGILNGHPGENMPPLRALSRDIQLGILAYTQTLPTRK